MAGLIPVAHVFPREKQTWMAGSPPSGGPATTKTTTSALQPSRAWTHKCAAKGGLRQA
jgi:hypothetical protein